MKHLFLDLEDTVVTPIVRGWGDFELLNIDFVKDLMEFEKPDQVNIFSFAIHNEKELDGFNQLTRPHLEKALGVTFGLVPTVDRHIIPTCCNAMGIHPQLVSFNDACEFWSKHQAFRLFVSRIYRNQATAWNCDTNVILVDDMAMNEEWHWPDLRLKGKTIRV